MSQAIQAVNAGPRLDRLPISRFHTNVLLLIGCGALLDAFDVYLAAGVLAATLKEGFSTLQSNALFMSITFFGMLIGAGVAGYVGDRFGRRYSYQVNLAIFGSASLLACFAPNMEVLIFFRFIMGIGMGAELVVAAGTLLEFIPPKYRGRWIALLGLMINSGFLLANGIGYFVIPGLGWRWMFGIAGIGALVIWILRKRMPESPRWLEAVGRSEEAEATLAKIEADVTARTGVLPPFTPSPALEVRKTSFSELFSKKMFWRSVVGTYACMAILVSVYGFVAWLPTFFVKQGLTVVQSLGFTTLMSFGAPTGAVVGFLLGDRLPRRTALIIFCAIAICLGLIYPNMHAPVEVTTVGFLLVTAIYTLVTITLYGYIPELFPTQYRLRGTGMTNMAGRAISIATPYLAISLFDRFGLTGVLTMVIGALSLLIIAVSLLRVETGSKQSLEDLFPDKV